MLTKPIGIIRSVFRERFGVPRQAGLVSSARAVLELPLKGEAREALRGLESFSHIWVIFWFHGTEDEGWRPLVRPPRLGGAKKIGVFASRSPHRPNPIGLSAVRLDRIDFEDSHTVRIEVSGGDFLDGTPLLDLKPYLRYSDSIPDARAGWAEERPALLQVELSPEAARFCHEQEHEPAGYPNLQQLIIELVGLDPRPAFQAGSKRGEGAEYSCRIHRYDVHWIVHEQGCLVTRIDRLAN